MSKKRSDLVDLVRTRLSSWKVEGSLKRRIMVGGAALTFGLGVYAMSKGEDAHRLRIMASHEGDFKRSRILGDPYQASNRARERLLDKTAKEYSDTQKAVAETLGRFEARMSDLEGKIVSGKAAAGSGGVNTAAPTPNQSAPAEGTARPENIALPLGRAQPPAGQHSAEPLDLRPITQLPRLRWLGRPDASALTPSKGPPVVSFPVQGKELRERTEVVLPVGSYVKAKLLTGVEAPEGTPYPSLIQLDFAHILPNKKSLDLRGCFMIAKAQGDLSTERVQMQVTKLSCVARDGQLLERDVNGFVVDAVDNSFAVIGTVNTKQDRVAAMAFLSSVVEGIGRAVQMAQTTEQTSAEGTTRRTLTGDQGKYIASGGASQAAGMVAQWYLKQAQSLLPTINIGSGQDIWVVMHESVALPQHYFTRVAKGEKHGKDYSFVNRLLE